MEPFCQLSDRIIRSFALTGLAIFAGMIGLLWFRFWDDEETIMIFYTFWMVLELWTAVALGLSAAWNGTFIAKALVHSACLSQTKSSIGIAYIVLGWLLWVNLTAMAMVAIQWAASASTLKCLWLRGEFKKKYLDLIHPKAKITMEIVNKVQHKEKEKEKK